MYRKRKPDSDHSWSDAAWGQWTPGYNTDVPWRSQRQNISQTWSYKVPPPPSPVQASSGLQGALCGSKALYVENLPAVVDCAVLRNVFDGYFHVRHIDVVALDAQDACGLVRFNNEQDTLEACLQFNGALIMNRPMRLRLHRGEFADLRHRLVKRATGQDGDACGNSTLYNVPPPPPPPVRVSSGLQHYTKLYVENLSAHVDCAALRDFVSGYFKVRDVDVEAVAKDEACGLLELYNEQDTKNACLQLNGAIIKGRPMYLRLDRKEFADFRCLKNANVQEQGKGDERPATDDETNDSDTQEDDGESPAASEANRADITQEDDGKSPAASEASGADIEEDDDDPAAHEETAGTKNCGPFNSSNHSPRVYVGNLHYNTSWQDLKD